MIILDTNIVSVLMGTSPSREVTAWYTVQDSTTIYLTTITRAEVRYGIARLPQGKRRDLYRRAADELFTRQLARTLPFDALAADTYGEIVAERERQGRPIGIADAQIAAIARTHDATIATRDTGGFDATGVNVVNPFVTS